MPRPNTYVLYQQAIRDIAHLRRGMDEIKAFTIQQCLDMAQITLHNCFGFGPDREEKFALAFMQTFEEYAQMCVEDSEDDPDIVYTEEKIDRVLREACGPQVPCFKDRYDLKNLYFRDKLPKKEKK